MKLLKKAFFTLSRLLTAGVILLGYVHLAAVGNPQTLQTAASAKEESVKLPILMYHSVLKDPSKQGKYVVSPSDIESDLKWLEENGYTTVLVSDLIAYTHGEPLPEKPILLTFDDGYYNNYLYVYPLLQKYNAKAVISVIGFYSEIFTQSGGGKRLLFPPDMGRNFRNGGKRSCGVRQPHLQPPFAEGRTSRGVPP